jgi:hypothetical protein
MKRQHYGGVDSPVDLMPHVSQDVPDLQPVQNLSDTDKLMFLYYREEMLNVLEREHEYEHYYRDHFHQTMNTSEGTLTMTYTYEEEKFRSDAIEILLKRRRLNEAFDGAMGSSLFCFFMQSICHLIYDCAALQQNWPHRSGAIYREGAN